MGGALTFLLLFVGCSALGFTAVWVTFWFGGLLDRAESAASGFQPDRPYTEVYDDLDPFFSDYSADPHDMRPASALDNDPTRGNQ